MYNINSILTLQLTKTMNKRKVNASLPAFLRTWTIHVSFSQF